MKSGFRSESFERKFSRILFVQNMITGSSKKKAENYPKRLLIKETQIKILPWAGANQPLNNWA